MRPELACGLSEPLGMLRHDYQIVTVPREQSTQFEPDSAGRAGDDCDRTRV